MYSYLFFIPSVHVGRKNHPTKCLCIGLIFVPVCLCARCARGAGCLLAGRMAGALRHTARAGSAWQAPSQHHDFHHDYPWCKDSASCAACCRLLTSAADARGVPALSVR